jgi:hypothetical protein
LKEYAAEKPDQLAARPAQPPNFEEAYMKWQPEGRLIREDGSVRFMDSPLLSIVYDEVGKHLLSTSPQMTAYSEVFASSEP